MKSSSRYLQISNLSRAFSGPVVQGQESVAALQDLRPAADSKILKLVDQKLLSTKNSEREKEEQKRKDDEEVNKLLSKIFERFLRGLCVGGVIGLVGCTGFFWYARENRQKYLKREHKKAVRAKAAGAYYSRNYYEPLLGINAHEKSAGCILLDTTFTSLLSAIAAGCFAAFPKTCLSLSVVVASSLLVARPYKRYD